MRGRYLIIGFGLVLVVFAAGLFYSINFLHYTKREFAKYKIAGLEVTDYQEIDGETSPIKYRACFQMPEGTVLYGDDREATPLVAPYWFKCFNAKTLTEDIDKGAVNAVSFNANQPFGVTSYMIVYPDGRGYAWRQINKCGEAKSAGDPLPADCPKIDNESENADG